MSPYCRRACADFFAADFLAIISPWCRTGHRCIGAAKCNGARCIAPSRCRARASRPFVAVDASGGGSFLGGEFVCGLIARIAPHSMNAFDRLHAAANIVGAEQAFLHVEMVGD